MSDVNATSETEMTEQEKKEAEGYEKPAIVDITKGYESEKVKGIKFFRAFSFDFTDSDGIRRVGTFVVKRLTIGEAGQVGVRVAMLNGGMDGGVPPAVAVLNSMRAHLEFALVERPEWFVMENLYDERIIFGVYGEVAKFEDSFRRPVEGRR